MEYITKDYLEKQGFYQLNRNLFNNNAYRRKITKLKTIKNQKIKVTAIEETLSDTSKLLYTILLNQYNRSLENGWFDSEGRIYIKFSVNKLAQYMGKSRDTIIKYKKELENNKLIKIISDKSNRSDYIFLGKLKVISLKEEKENSKYEKVKTIISTFKAEDMQSTSSCISLDIVDSGLVDNIDSIKLTNKTYNKTTTDSFKINPLNFSIENNSSKFLFLNKKEYKNMNDTTKLNIINTIPNITEDVFKKIYVLTEKELKFGKIKNFNAVLYKGLKGEWIYSEKIKINNSALDEEKKIKREYNYYIEYFQCTGNFEEAFEKFKNAIKLYSPEIYNSYLTSFETIKNINI
ncbi:hypothetical protein FV113G1_24570 [Fusobacterium varium]|nr:hypothetical protein FV113G1_24570 [Fusobacterium varium]